MGSRTLPHYCEHGVPVDGGDFVDSVECKDCGCASSDIGQSGHSCRSQGARDYDMSIHTNPDAMAWAKFYKETFPDADLDLMVGWFANAMMAMYDHLSNGKIAELEAKLATAEVDAARYRWLRERITPAQLVENGLPYLGAITREEGGEV